MAEQEEFVATGRRKTAVASVRLRPAGKGKIDVNGKAFEQYFPSALQRKELSTPLDVVGRAGTYDIVIRVKGGGIEGQVDAVKLGIARALVLEDEARRGDLKSLGLLRRDPRRRERKKYGRAGARKRFQFSKR